MDKRILNPITGTITHIVKIDNQTFTRDTSPEYLDWLSRHLKMSKEEILKLWGVK